MAVKDTEGRERALEEQSNPLDPAQLWRDCLQGKEAAWQALFQWCRKKVIFKYKLAQEADDVAQEVCLKLNNGGLERLREPKAFLGFVGRAVHNEVVNRIRWRNRHVSLDQPVGRDEEGGQSMVDTMPAATPDPEEQINARRMLRKWAELMDTLPSYCKEVMDLLLRYRVGEVASYRQMAQMLDRPEGTISGQINRCLEHLRQRPEFLDTFGRKG